MLIYHTLYLVFCGKLKGKNKRRNNQVHNPPFKSRIRLTKTGLEVKLHHIEEKFKQGIV